MYQSKTANYSHQDIALDRMSDKMDFALFCEQGTGKTKIAIDRMGELFADDMIEAVLVIAPKGVHYQWYSTEIPKHFGLPYNGYCHGLIREGIHDQSNITWFCTTYSALSTRVGWDKVKSFMDSFTFAVIFDESHFIKNPSTQRWKAAKRISDYPTCFGRLLLSGTPIAKNLMDEWSQFRIISEDIFSVYSKKRFKERYCVLGGYNNRDIVGHHSLDDFQKRTKPYIFRARKSSLNIPPKIYSAYHFQMVEYQKKMYDEYREDLVKRILSGAEERAGAMVDILRMQQISNGFINGKDGTRSLFKNSKDNPRIIALKELTEANPDQQAIIWCRFIYDVDHIQRNFDAVAITGKVKHSERQDRVKHWFDGNCRFLVATVGTLGVGYNLQIGGCSWAIYYSNRESYVDRAQSEDRIHRIGAKNKCLYTDLICDGSRDVAILSNINMKRFLSQYTMKDIVAELEGDVLIMDEYRGIKQNGN